MLDVLVLIGLPGIALVTSIEMTRICLYGRKGSVFTAVRG